MHMRRWMLAGSVALVMFGCGTNDRSTSSKSTGLTADMFAEEYRGRLFQEMFDADGNVVDRADLEDSTLVTRVDPKGRVFLGYWEVDACSVWIDPSTFAIPAQSCAVSGDGDFNLTIEYAGTWALSDGELELDVEATYSDALKEETDNVDDYQYVRTVKTTFTGTQTTPPRAATGSDDADADDDVVVDEQPPGEEPDGVRSHEGDRSECESVAECRVDQECSAGSCVDHLSCDWFEDTIDSSAGRYVYSYEWASCSDGKEYLGACTEADHGWSCIGSINGVATCEFFWDGSSNHQMHRVFNQECGWRVPELYSY